MSAAEVRWTPETANDSDRIASESNPWLRDELTGTDLDLIAWEMSGRIPLTVRTPDECENGGCFEGVIPGMDTAEGVQRCDVCNLFPGDLEAAHYLAQAINKANPALRVAVYYEKETKA